MNRIFWLLTSFCLFLVGCNGVSDKTEQAQNSEVTVNQLSLSTFTINNDPLQSFPRADTVQVVATLLDSNNMPVSGESITFATTLGELSQESKLSNADGQAIVNITNSNLDVRSGEVSVTYSNLSSQVFFEYLDTSVSSQENSLSAQLLLDGDVASHIRTDETVQIKATLLDADGMPIEGEIVQFSAELGQLNAASSLTNAQGIATVTLAGNGALGAGLINVSSSATIDTSLIKYELLPADVVISDNDFLLGSYNESAEFVEGVIALSNTQNQLSAGGTIGLSVALVDSENNRVMSSIPVSFTSSCVSNNNANIDALVFSINGQANATFEDLSCAGAAGIEDVLQASITINGITKTATVNLAILGEGLGSIEFISAEPSSIVLKGAGGVNQQETSTLTFLVKSAIGNPLAQQEVEFSLNSSVGGVAVFPLSGLTNSQGLITTQVSSGNVPAAIRVTAKASVDNNDEINTVQTQSDLLSINTGLPEQRSMSLAASVFNPEAGEFNGEESVITAYLADNFNNPVPDGTTVNFTTEGGVIQPSCTTTNGRCSVIWTSAEPRVDNHRITILATALGHESFFDTNGNNFFDEEDGAAINDSELSSGFKRISPATSGFVDMSEAWRDDNANLQYDAGEIFIDFDNDNTFDNADGLFNGPQCEGDLCAEQAKSINVRDSLELVMSSSQVTYNLVDEGGIAIADSSGVGSYSVTVADDDKLALVLSFADSALQTLPINTNISITSDIGTLSGNTNVNVFNNKESGFDSLTFSVINAAGGEPETGSLTIKFTTAKGVETTLAPIELNLL